MINCGILSILIQMNLLSILVSTVGWVERIKSLLLGFSASGGPTYQKLSIVEILIPESKPTYVMRSDAVYP